MVRNFIIYVGVFFLGLQAFAETEVISPKKLLKEVLASKFTYVETGRIHGFHSIDSCLFTSERFVLVRNYCRPAKNYPAKGFLLISPEYGIFELYEENEEGQQFRNLRILTFEKELGTMLSLPMSSMNIEKTNTVKTHFYKANGRACWSTNLSRYTMAPEAGCIYEDIERFPAWKKESQKFVMNAKTWKKAMKRLLAKTTVPTTVTEFYLNSDNSEAEADILTSGLLSPAKTYADISKTLLDLQARYPQNVEIFELGISNLGEKILAMKSGDGPIKNLVVGTHHGNEYGAAEVAEAVAKHFAESPIPGQTVYVIPVLNVNGYDVRSRRERIETGMTVDPNRDYPGPCVNHETFKLNSTKALADFVEAADIVNSVTLHTYYPGVLYPWGISTHDLDTGYTELFKELGAAAAHFSNYKVGNSTEELYPADGTFEDYAYWKHGVWSLLFEMGFSHSPSQSQVQHMIEVNVPGIRRLFEMAPTQRAPDYAFKGKCNGMSILMDRHDE